MADSTHRLLSLIRDALTGVLSIRPPAQTTANAVIGVGASLSAGVDLGENRLSRLVMPAAWTAASITFQASEDGVTYRDLHSATAEISTLAAANRSVALDPTLFRSIRYLKVRSGTGAAAVNQTAGATVVLVLTSR